MEELSDDFLEELMGESEEESIAADIPSPLSRKDLTYCEFCNEWYNEYHFGDIDD